MSTKRNGRKSTKVEIVFEGEVTKSPPFEKMSNISSYCKRWMALVKIDKEDLKRIEGRKGTVTPSTTDDEQDVLYCLCYWDSIEEKRKGRKPKRTVCLLKSTSVSIQRHPCFADKFPYTFAVNTCQRNFYIDAENEETQGRWFNEIKQAILSTSFNEIIEPIYESIFVWDEVEESPPLTRPLAAGGRQRKVSIQSHSSPVAENSDKKREEMMFRHNSVDSGFVPDSSEEYSKRYEHMNSAIPGRFNRTESLGTSSFRRPRDLSLKKRKSSVPLPPPIQFIHSPKDYENTIDPADLEYRRGRRSQSLYPITHTTPVDHSPISRSERSASEKRRSYHSALSQDIVHENKAIVDENNNSQVSKEEPLYYRLEEDEKNQAIGGAEPQPVDLTSIQFYDIKLVFPSDAVMSFNENGLTIKTKRITYSCTRDSNKPNSFQTSGVVQV